MFFLMAWLPLFMIGTEPVGATFCHHTCSVHRMPSLLRTCDLRKDVVLQVAGAVDGWYQRRRRAKCARDFQSTDSRIDYGTRRKLVVACW